PVSYMQGTRQPVRSRYRLEGDRLAFEVQREGEGAVVIDPVLAFSSFSGSSADNFGYTATYDASGHLYGGGIVFNAGYPVSTGALQGFFAGGSIDVGISKWSPDGASLVWSTYLGGSGGAETPHSLVVNAQDELFVLGATGSADFPTTPGCFDGSFNPGGGMVSWTNVSGGYGFSLSNGADAFIARFNASATALLGATFLGGSGHDGLNNSGTLTHNYGDHFRGEIALDAAGNPVVATSTRSADMPVTPGAAQPALGGGQDAYLCRFNPALTTLQLGTYFGGSGDESGLGVQFDSAGRIFMAGGTTSGDMPAPGAPLDNSFNGVSDGYVARYSPAGALLAATYLGTALYDQCYFVQLDAEGFVYAVGQTLGPYPVSPGVYANPGSGQFIHKLSNDLSAPVWSTRVGNGSAAQALSPTAFLVSDCGQIYLSGWAGSTNNNAGNTQSTTNGCPVTPDAYQPTTTGSDVYLMVLQPDASGLAYATFFGGSSAEHVDGGTSRFDKNGTVYHAVCAGCGGSDGFPTTPGAWSTTNNSFNCNLGVFKFDLSPAQAIIGIDGPSTICPGASAQFTNNSVGGNTYTWTFGDGTGSAAFAPSHAYAAPGEYTVMLVLSDDSGCAPGDTATLQITVLPEPTATIDPVAPICPGASTQLQAGGGSSYSWSPATGLSATNVPDPVASPAETTTYTVTVADACGSDQAQVTVPVIAPEYTLTPDTSICIGESIILNATGGGTYAWEPHPSLSATDVADPTATPTETTTYHVTITTADGCVAHDSLTVEVQVAPPLSQLQDTAICAGSSVQLEAAPADHYAWLPANGLTAPHAQAPVVSPTEPTLYIVLLTNACGSTIDSAFVDIVLVEADAGPDTLICPGQPVQLWASGGLQYQWSPADGLSSATAADPIATPAASTLYSVAAFDANGCTDTALVLVELHPLPYVQAGEDLLAEYGNPVTLTAVGSGTLTWSPTAGLSDPHSPSPTARPEETTAFTVTVTDSLGCTNTDEVTVVVLGSLYVPNAFTPNGDGCNDFFFAMGKEIGAIELLVFDRWGLLIWSTDRLSGRWDGTHNGQECPIDTSVWKVDAIEVNGRRHEAMGHVSLLR
ncbi:MAG: PKD domain-containing protein, partial [Flavobacteriales bacterium]